MPRHRHADVIHAWAEGEAIEYKNLPDGKWYEIKYPHWDDETEYRIKPKIVKKEGWVNIYGPYAVRCAEAIIGDTGSIYATKEIADLQKRPDRLACTRIEWEEEV